LEIDILQTEFNQNNMWTRETIKEIKRKNKAHLLMSEQQIYKWWWDQTRKFGKKMFSNQITPEPTQSQQGQGES
jgi:hypothetical protein